MKGAFLVLLALMATASAVELNSKNFDSKTAGKSVFIKFLAPWWGHCKSMKPAWDKLMKNYNKDGAEGLVADVDCTVEKDLCSKHGVRGYPTIKYGDVNDLQDYKGGRDYDTLYKFASENLGPTCGPANLDLCDDDQKAEIETAMGKSEADLAAEVEKYEDELKASEELFKSEVEKLQERFKELSEAKEATAAKIQESGLGVLKQVLAHKAKAGKDEL